MSSSVAARRETVGRSTPRAYLVLVVALLLVQCALRIHKSAEFPVYIDEYRHIHRAQLVYTFENNPIEFSNGKLLVYYWLGLFSPQGHSAVVVGRYAIAIVSLITGAVTCSIARRLFGPLPALFALAFYALAPHVVFFERLALADPVASALATLSIWQLLRYLNTPSRRQAILVGVLITSAVFAKLTTALLMGFPVIAIMLASKERVGLRSRQSISRWSERLWQQHGSGLKLIQWIYIAAWLGLLILVLISLAAGNRPVLFPTRTIGIRFNAGEALLFRAEVLYTIIQTMLSVPVAGALALTIPFLLWRAPRRTLFLVMWLAVLWGPSLILTWMPETRYLVIGYPALAVLVGAVYWLGIRAIRALADWRGSRWARSTASWAAASVVVGGLSVWALLFVAPFMTKLVHAPETLALPVMEIELFFRGPNGWAVSDALAYLDEHGERLDERVPVIGRFHYTAADRDYCGLAALYVPDTLDWDCDVVIMDYGNEPEDINAMTPRDIWLDVRTTSGQRPFAYLVVDRPLPAISPDMGLDATKVFERQRPHDGSIVSVWRVDLAEG